MRTFCYGQEKDSKIEETRGIGIKYFPIYIYTIFILFTTFNKH